MPFSQRKEAILSVLNHRFFLGLLALFGGLWGRLSALLLVQHTLFDLSFFHSCDSEAQFANYKIIDFRGEKINRGSNSGFEKSREEALFALTANRLQENKMRKRQTYKNRSDWSELQGKNRTIMENDRIWNNFPEN